MGWPKMVELGLAMSSSNGSRLGQGLPIKKIGSCQAIIYHGLGAASLGTRVANHMMNPSLHMRLNSQFQNMIKLPPPSQLHCKHPPLKVV